LMQLIFDIHENSYDVLLHHIGRTPLHFAAAYGQTDMVKLLVEKGASTMTEDRDGASPHLYGCNHFQYREEYQKAVSSKVCKNEMRKEVVDEGVDASDDDEDLTDGGWNAKEKRKTHYSCGFDVRNANRLTHFNFVMGYLTLSIPVVLRGGMDWETRDSR